MDYKKVLVRKEKKYLITEGQKKELLLRLSGVLVKSEHYKSDVRSIYFDTEQNDLIIKSIGRPEFKEKMRVRSYGIPKLSDSVYLEMKMKVKDEEGKIGYKRRMILRLVDFYDFFEGRKKLTDMEDSQIAREIEYVYNYLGLVPKIFIEYDRESWEGASSEETGDLRVTFDEKLRYREKNLKLEGKAACKKYISPDFPEGTIIMEIKTGVGMPLSLVTAMNECGIFPRRFSKYGNIYKKIVSENKEVNV